MATPTRCEQAALDLTEARAQRKAIMLYGNVVRVTHGDKTTEFSKTNLGDFDRYIAALECEVDACEGRVANCRRAHRIVPCGW